MLIFLFYGFVENRIAHIGSKSTAESLKFETLLEISQNLSVIINKYVSLSDGFHEMEQGHGSTEKHCIPFYITLSK